MPVKKDGTCTTDKDAMADKRICCKVCKFCNQTLSVSHLHRDHLKPDSTVRCTKIPTEELGGLLTTEDKKAWTSASIKACKIASLTENKFWDVYTGSSYFTNEELLNKVKKHIKSYQGKLYINPDIRDKLARKQKMEPVEHKNLLLPNSHSSPTKASDGPHLWR